MTTTNRDCAHVRQIIMAAIESLESRRLLSVTQPSLSLDAASDSGIVGDLITNVAAPMLTGAGTAGNTISLFDGAALLVTRQQILL